MPKTSKEPKFDNRVRFNWGFHDAMFDAAHGMPDRRNVVYSSPLSLKKQEHIYALGYEAGYAEYKSTGKVNPSSENAWLKIRAEHAEPGSPRAEVVQDGPVAVLRDFVKWCNSRPVAEGSNLAGLRDRARKFI